MDPERVRAYLQVACAGLGFDIGEVWWTSNELGSSTLATIEEKKDGNEVVVAASSRQKRFVQLYTSKSYEDMRSILVRPSDDSDESVDNSVSSTVSTTRKPSKKDELDKHKLSPRLVDAISNTTQILWANSERREGLLGRSDLPLQTAVGMPVAVDASGNMCVVVMFSPAQLRSSDEAMEYLEFISRAATSSSIPCLLPVFDEKSPMKRPSQSQHQVLKSITDGVRAASLGDGVTARFVSLDVARNTNTEYRRKKSEHEVTAAPKDCFGIPMLPAPVEIAKESPGKASMWTADPFDEASYGVWSTIMDTPIEDLSMICGDSNGSHIFPKPDSVNSSASVASNDSSARSVNQPILEQGKGGRLEEFAAAFLGMSVFDAADIWIPMTGDSMDVLSHVKSITTSTSNDALSNFALLSEGLTIQSWSGAVGRAFASGNPVWTSNKQIFIDQERVTAFAITNILTVVAIPIMSPGTVTPVCVVSCYSLVKSDPVPFVLRFVQQALRLLWAGLDRVQPHVAVGEKLWTNVAAADLGEMAADLEMQQEFTKRKRSHSLISAVAEGSSSDDTLSVDLTTMGLGNGAVDVGEPTPLTIVPVESIPMSVPVQAAVPEPRKHVPVSSIKHHMEDAIKSVADTNAWRTVATTNDRRKRAHVEPSGRLSPTIPTPDASEHNGLGFSLNEYDPIPVSGKVAVASAPVTAATPSPQTPTVVYSSGSSSAPSPQPQTIVYNASAAPSPQPHKIVYGNASAPSPQQPAAVYAAAPAAPSPVMFAAAPSTAPTPTAVIYNQSSAPSPAARSPQPSPVVFNPVPCQAGSPQSLQPAPMPVAPTLATTSPTGDVIKPLRQPSSIPRLNASATATPVTAPVSAPAGFVATSHAKAADPVPPQQISQQTLYQAQLPNGQIVYYHAQPGGPVFQSSASGPVMLPTASVEPAPAVCLPTATKPTTQPSKPHKVCRIEGCESPAVSRRPYCERHTGNRLCEFPSCTKCAQGATRFCIAHGGGRRCTYPGCDKGARDKFFCAAHGGGKRCQNPGCTKSAVGGSNLCTSHGGGRRCSIAGCDKSAQSSTKFCVKHGGGKKCAYQGCERVARGRTLYCAGHGGGIRCKLDGCNRVAIGKLQLCRAHGGGSKTKARNVPPAVPLHPPSPPMPMQPNGLTQSI